MNENELQDALENILDAIAEAREEADDENDEGAMAEYARDMADALEGIEHVTTFDRCGLLTRDAGIVLRMKDRSEFQITIVQSRPATDDAGDDE